MVSFKDRKTLRQELVASGYSWEYLDEWQPKTTLYRHAPGLNAEGEVSQPVGSEIRGVPGNPDYVIPKARIGWFPYPPNESCTCRWCTERAVEADRIQKIPDEYKCGVSGCDYIATSKTHANKLSAVRMHTQRHTVNN
jgi:hypothetical protein